MPWLKRACDGGNVFRNLNRGRSSYNAIKSIGSLHHNILKRTDAEVPRTGVCTAAGCVWHEATGPMWEQGIGLAHVHEIIVQSNETTTGYEIGN